jgi:N-methylhydantoinase B
MNKSLRELTPGEFDARYSCDRLTATVLSSRFRFLMKQMCTHLMGNAFSPVIRDWYDFAATLAGPPEERFPMAAVSDSLLIFTGTMSESVRNTVEEYGPDNLRPGDILIGNDPVRTGTHVNDVLFVRPVFVGGRLVGFLNLMAHMIDMGGTVPGGFGLQKQTTYENGLTIPPMLMFSGDRMVRSTFSLIFDNARFGELMAPDFMSIAGNLRLGERLLVDAIDRYGTDAYLGAMRFATDVSAEAMCAGFREIPDGTYEGEDLIDCDGIDASEQYVVRVKVTIAGERAEVDLSGSSRQTRTCINGGWLDTRTGVGVALKYLVDPLTPFTSGVFRDFDIVLPPGSIGCAMPPDGPVMFNFDVQEAVLNAVFGALAQALGPRAIAGDLGSGMAHTATGVRTDGSLWATVGTCGGEMGPWGASRHGDGENSLVIMVSNCIAPAVEATEAAVPGVVIRSEYAIDSGGPGIHRGGAATIKDSLWLENSSHYPNVVHVRRPSGFGVDGGGPGTGGGVWLWRGNGGAPRFIDIDEPAYELAEPVAGVLDPQTHTLDAAGEYVHPGREPVWEVGPGSTFRYRTNAGGGWGDPLLREPERVLRDVRDEYVSVGAARDVYGVAVVGDPVYDPEGLAIDWDETRALRRSSDGAETQED